MIQLVIASIYLLSLIGTAKAQIAISPLGGVLDSDRQELSFQVTNPSDQTLFVTIGWIDLQATSSGSYRPASPEERSFSSAAPYLQLSRSTMTLAPGARADLKVQRHGAALPHRGEWRSHLKITSTASRELAHKTNFTLPLDMGVAVTVPVILRKNPKQADLKINALNLARNRMGELNLDLNVQRSGDATWHGQMLLDLPDGRHITQPLRLYPEARLSLRQVNLNTAALPSGALKVTLKPTDNRQASVSKTVNIGPPVPGF